MGPEDWRREYEVSRYLREADDAILERRFQDLTSNLWSTDAVGNVVPTWDPKMRAALLRLILHVTLEQMDRSKTPTTDFDEHALRRASSAQYSPPRLKALFTGSPVCFAKFGKGCHIVESFENGVFRIAPASSYKDPSLNSAQADKELEHVTVTPNEELVRTRLADAVARQLPTSAMTDGGLSYYDPYMVGREQLVPIFSKHFRYLYQNEYRFAWTVPNGEPLKPFFVELGALHDIAEFLELAGHGIEAGSRAMGGNDEPHDDCGEVSNLFPLIARDPRLA